MLYADDSGSLFQTPNLLAERAFELVSRRRPGHALIFIIDEVGQYVSRSVQKMLDLQAVVQAFGREGKNRVSRKQAIAPCWIVVTSQEKLNEVVDALESKKIELARLQDRFPYLIDLICRTKSTSASTSCQACGCAGVRSGISAAATAPSSSRRSRCWCTRGPTWLPALLGAW